MALFAQTLRFLGSNGSSSALPPSPGSSTSPIFINLRSSKPLFCKHRVAHAAGLSLLASPNTAHPVLIVIDRLSLISDVALLAACSGELIYAGRSLWASSVRRLAWSVSMDLTCEVNVAALLPLGPHFFFFASFSIVTVAFVATRLSGSFLVNPKGSLIALLGLNLEIIRQR